MKKILVAILITAIGISFVGCDDSSSKLDRFQKTGASYTIAGETMTEVVDIQTGDVYYVSSNGAMCPIYDKSGQIEHRDSISLK